MSKKPKEKCQHGLSPVYAQGCPTCVLNALHGGKFLNDNNLDLEELWEMLLAQFKTKETWDAAVAAAKATVAERRKKQEACDGE